MGGADGSQQDSWMSTESGTAIRRKRGRSAKYDKSRGILQVRIQDGLWMESTLATVEHCNTLAIPGSRTRESL